MFLHFNKPKIIIEKILARVLYSILMQIQNIAFVRNANNRHKPSNITLILAILFNC